MLGSLTISLSLSESESIAGQAKYKIKVADGTEKKSIFTALRIQ